MRLWLHTGHDGDPGYEVWCLDLVGFATYAQSRDEVLARVERKLDEHLLWLTVHGLPASRPGSGLQVVEELAGDELLFAEDREPASVAEVDTTLTALEHTRADLVRELDELPDEVLDFDPPYERFAAWASWRTIRQIVAHVANAETHYYAQRAGMRATTTRVNPEDDWRAYLPRSRAQTTMFLQALKASRDRARVTDAQEAWSVRKALRRMVRHELQHTRSVRRIIAAFDAR